MAAFPFISLIISLLVPLFIGFALSLLFLPPGEQRLPPALRVFLGAGAGIGVASLVGFGFLPWTGRFSFLIREFALAAFVVALVWTAWRKGFLREAFSRVEGGAGREGRRSLAVFALAVTALSAVASFALSIIREPHGKWDAFLIWNMHARFLYRSGADWMDYFRSGLDWTHPDYPYLLPLTVTRAWEYCGGETLAAPIIISALFTLLVAGLLGTALATLRGREQGVLAAMVLAASPLFVLIGASQLADIPLSFFILGTIVVLCLHDRLQKPRASSLVMAGLLAGLAAWTKNEGILFCALLLSVRPLVVSFSAGSRRAMGEFLSLAAGAAPALLVLFIFKTAIAPASDLIAGQGSPEIMAKLCDAGRYGAALTAYLRTGLTFTQGIPDIRTPFHLNPAIPGIILLTVYLVLAGLERDPRDRKGIFTGWAVIVLALAGYFLIFIITPHDLNWHLLTALNRLFLQLWPAAIFLVLMAARSPWHLSGETPSGERKKKKIKGRETPLK